MATPPDLAKMVPGFEFLQSLMKGSAAGVPGMGQWIAPTLDPAELDKRISELKTVQYWLDNNAKLLAATIQGLEVQRMTLSTLQSMNLPLADLHEALKIKPQAAPAAAPVAAPVAASAAPAAASAADAAPAPRAAAAAVDPMQWWGALTQQFSQLAAQAAHDVAGAAAAAPSDPPAPAPARAAARTAPRKRSR